MSFASSIAAEFGVAGIARSVYHSMRQTRSPTKLLIAPSVITRFHGDYTFDIDTRFIVRGPGLGQLEMEDGGTLRVQNGPFQVGRESTIVVGGTLELGDSYIGPDSRITCKNRISIGDGCAIAWNVTLLDDDRHTLVIDDVEQDQSGEIVIKDNVWIGHNVTVKKNVSIGESAVVASNSVVTSDVPPNTLVAGAPAEVIKTNVTWKR